MQKILRKVSRIIIYLSYAYLFVWQVYYFNQELFYDKELRPEEITIFRFLPSVVLLFFVILLYIDMLLKQKIILVCDCFFTASLLYLYNTFPSIIMATVILLFGVIVAFFEISVKESFS